VPAQRLEYRVGEQILCLDLGQVAGDEGLIVGPEPVEARKASSTSRVDRPRAYISVTSDSSTSLLPSRKLINDDRNASPAPRTCGTATSTKPSAVRSRPRS
jgi:hypothetical protein